MSKPSAAERCPLCRFAASAEHAPFCSAGCRDRDLLQWLGEGYAVPGAPADPEVLERALDSAERPGI